MNEPSKEKQVLSPDKDADDAPRSINLVLVYGLMALALVVAIGVALLIVLPFYHRR
jgi:hypothetical protein